MREGYGIDVLYCEVCEGEEEGGIVAESEEGGDKEGKGDDEDEEERNLGEFISSEILLKTWSFGSQSCFGGRYYGRRGKG